MPNNPWFRPKEFGKGYTPASWQGWLVIFGAIVVFLTLVFVAIARMAQPTGHI
jgi:hypothetical protein